MSILIKNGTIICPLNGKLAGYDVLLQDGIISHITPDIDISADEIIDAHGKYIMPGFFDMHCHLREPGYEYKETLNSGMLAALAGGFTTLACMPNTNPAIDNTETVQYILKQAQRFNLCRLYPVGAITIGQSGKQLSDFRDLQQAGVVALSDDGKPVANAELMRAALQSASSAGLKILSHCEDQTLSGAGVMNKGALSMALELEGIPAVAEESITARDILLAENLGVAIHIMHVSTAGSVEIIRAAKARGVQVTAETCPHYFSLTEQACSGQNTAAKVNPPLRTTADVQAIIRGLIDNTIDVIATDHAPHSVQDKNCSFADAAFGISGLETAFAVVNSFLVKPGYLSLETVSAKMSLNPARILGKPTGVIEVGSPADITIIDPDAIWRVNSAKFASGGKNTPFAGIMLTGAVEHTIVSGVLKYSRADNRTQGS